MESIYLFLKRLVDIIVSILMLPVFLIIFLVFAPIIKFTSKGGVFFKQERVGKNKKIFKIYKFRSMYLSDDDSYVKDGDARVTLIGRFLRKYKLDEFPQLLNVLIGDMSVVGPRPQNIEISNIIEEKLPASNVRYKVKPGLVGLYFISDIRRTDNLEDLMRQYIETDIKYVSDKSIFLDIKIFFLTILKIIKGH